ncbi:PREDICTED: uncharacterized protein LOC104585994 isoform X2 [Nelumbo nucifera]|uniref:Uncharacterized protein n=2 Tax=Nelumbo nucifera TaxID=4432 RepID=A0A822XXV4_NELNU|nr:PREDICTED: uncharacterized protein LOC104585994 isoform X2 [Nelumbo nucifera]DAD23939.1 TPA_asm: hypothetical protein HUJ06_025402 [Nelumbo nucifera]
MSLNTLLANVSSFHPRTPLQRFHRKQTKNTGFSGSRHRPFSSESPRSPLPYLYTRRILKVQSFQPQDAGDSEPLTTGDTPNGQDRGIEEVLRDLKVETRKPGNSFLAKLAIALGIAATMTVISVGFKRPTLGSSLGFSSLGDGSSALLPTAAPVGFTLNIFKWKVVLPEYAPGWIYFWLLMAAGFGLFISEEALNVGISLARMLSLDGTWKSFAESFSRNAPYIISTVLWVYWGVCISDMVPFYFGKLFRQAGASDDVCSKLGIGKQKALSITRLVQRYGNLIGFVERFSLGVRNPTAFLAGALGISPDCFFAGVCCGGLVTLPIQLSIGFLLRERPMVALAGVATAVGIWTVFPYAMAALTAMFLFLRRRYAN